MNTWKRWKFPNLDRRLLLTILSFVLQHVHDINEGHHTIPLSADVVHTTLVKEALCLLKVIEHYVIFRASAVVVHSCGFHLHLLGTHTEYTRILKFERRIHAGVGIGCCC